MTVVNRSEQPTTPTSSAPLRLVRTAGTSVTERVALLRAVPVEGMSEGDVAKTIGNILTEYKENEQKQRTKALAELKDANLSERGKYSYDAMAADASNKRAEMATAILRGFGMLDAVVVTDFNGVYKKADQRAVQSTGSDDEAKQIRLNMVESMGNYLDHPALRAARSIVEVGVTGGVERKEHHAMIMQRAIAEVFDQQGIPPTPEAS